MIEITGLIIKSKRYSRSHAIVITWENVYRTGDTRRITKTITVLSLANLERGEMKGKEANDCLFRARLHRILIPFSPNDQINSPI